MVNKYAQKAEALKKNYEAENAVLASWRDELMAPSPGSPESNLLKDWRDGWACYMNVVIDIGAEKIEALHGIIDAPTSNDAHKLVEDLKQQYDSECAHYADLANQSRKIATRTANNLASLLEQEESDRSDYRKQL